MKILFLAANPPGTARLDLDKEVSKIDDGLQRSKLRDQFHLSPNGQSIQALYEEHC
ncbi:MAG: hypothetical protein V7K89_19945 [Nostoc sp.]|uniref:hypothetical protein n=1 Tax=Nostoc sp. TaxID=1180 RepID=UPI002FFA8B0F